MNGPLVTARRRLSVACATLAAAVGGSLVPAGVGSTAAADTNTITWHGRTWNVLVAGPNPELPTRQAHFLRENVGISNGNLIILTRRHCTAGAPTRTNARVATCGKKNNTKYSSGRVELPGQLAGVRRFSVSFRARMPARSASGARQALWMTNTLYDCTQSQWGEFDNLEWYTKEPRRARQTAHMGCQGSRTAQQDARPAIDRSAFHTWRVQRRGTVIRFFQDGRLTQKVVCGKGRFAGTGDCSAILNNAYTMIMQGEVFSAEPDPAKLLEGPRDGQPFPVMRMVVSGFKITVD